MRQTSNQTTPMKIDVYYKIYEPSELNPYMATANVRGDTFVGVGKTWDEAKQSLIDSIKRKFDTEIPSPESVEVPLKSEEEPSLNWMDADLERKGWNPALDPLVKPEDAK